MYLRENYILTKHLKRNGFGIESIMYQEYYQFYRDKKQA